MIIFEKQWEKLTPKNEPLFQRVDATHILDFYTGKDVNGDILLSLVSDDEPQKVNQSHGINITITRRSDSRWLLVFRLIEPGFEKIFYHICEDLVESSRNLPPSISGVSFVIARFKRWQKLLEKGKTGIMEEHILRGLLGELIFLEKAIQRHGGKCSVQAWTGPSGAKKDFIYENLWYEIKTVRPDASSVLISSEEQLDGDFNSGYLFVVTLEKCESKANGCFSPSDIIIRIKEILKNEPLAEIEFEEKLLDAGYIEHQDYQQKFYKVLNKKYYVIKEGFPRITPVNLPAGVRNISYEIDIKAMNAFEK